MSIVGKRRRRMKPTRSPRSALAASVAFWMAVALCPSAAAQEQVSTQLPGKLASVGIDQNLDQSVPLDILFADESGREVALGEYFGTKPVLVAMVYYECPMLCTLVLNGMVRALNVMDLHPGEDFEIVIVSIDPGETPELARQKKAEYAKNYIGGSDAGWHFLTGRQESIQRLAKALGFRYNYDAEKDLYVHASALMVLTPQGRIARYFYGVEYDPRDIRLGLVEASRGEIGSPVDQVLLYCYAYDPATGKYSVVVMNLVRLGGVLTLLAVGGFMGVMFLRDRRAKRSGRTQ